MNIAASIAMPKISPPAFARLQAAFRDASGITLSGLKETLVATRLRTRIAKLGLPDYEAYCNYLNHNADSERQHMVDLLTTNETYFFREPAHFRSLRALLEGELADRPVRIWSAASSTGEEAFSIAMTLADLRGMDGWEITASDISTRVLERARSGLYPLQRLENMPKTYLRRFCLRGTGEYNGQFLIERNLRQHVQFLQHNLLHDATRLGRFDVVFLRNALIYFDEARKQEILNRVVATIQPGGYLFVGHAESLHGHSLPLRRMDKAMYQRL